MFWRHLFRVFNRTVRAKVFEVVPLSVTSGRSGNADAPALPCSLRYVGADTGGVGEGGTAFHRTISRTNRHTLRMRWARLRRLRSGSMPRTSDRASGPQKPACPYTLSARIAASSGAGVQKGGRHCVVVTAVGYCACRPQISTRHGNNTILYVLRDRGSHATNLRLTEPIPLSIERTVRRLSTPGGSTEVGHNTASSVRARQPHQGRSGVSNTYERDLHNHPPDVCDSIGASSRSPKTKDSLRHPRAHR